MPDFKKLLTPGKVGSLTLKNRMITTAMVTLFADEDGLPTERYIRYHEEKARGGWGLQITEDYAITPTGRTFSRLPGLWHDGQIAAHAAFVDRVHQAGGTICAQLFHPGRQTSAAVAGEQPVAPSALRDPAMPDTPRELSNAEVKAMVRYFAEAAWRAKEAGFDMVELHGAHGYLLGQFFSAHANKRADEYGGCFENRARFGIEVVQAVREAVGSDFPLSFRLNVNDHVEGGVTPREAAAYASLLETAGVDLFNCSQGVYESMELIIPPAAVQPAQFVNDVAQVRAAVQVPVAAVGRINDPFVAESLVGSSVDFVAMGRASLADPDFPRKVAEGRSADILQCIACCRGCAGEENRGEPLCCILNPRTGREGDYSDAPAERPGHIVVVGGGIAGCEAALAAASRGHRVTVLEATDRLGGQWLLAAVPPGKEDFASFVAWQRRRLAELGVTVRYGVKADGAEVLRHKPDGVVLATGSEPLMPPIPGLLANDRVVDARQVLAGAKTVSGRVAVLGGGLVGAETAELLARQGCAVSVFEMLPVVAAECEPNPRTFLMAALADRGVQLHPSTRVCSVDDGYLTFERSDGTQETETFDCIVAALGARPRPSMRAELEALGFTGPLRTVGDEHAVGDAFGHVREGYQAGLEMLP